MISITSAQLNAWMAFFFFPFFRILALVTSAPVLGASGSPMRVKVGFALIVTVVVAPTLGDIPHVDPGSALGLMILAQQVAIGLAMGMAMRIVFSAVEMAGNLIGLQMGLGFATFFDPQNSGQTPVMASFIGMLAILVFLAMNGHTLMIEVVVQSFHELPVTVQPMSAGGLRVLVGWGREVFLGGVLLSLPVIAALLITNISIGIMTRAAPQLNIFAVGFPITLLAGFIVLSVSLPYFIPLLEHFFHDAAQVMLQIPRLSMPPVP
jgi:flagellar biosynthetic protein FliR